MFCHPNNPPTTSPQWIPCVTPIISTTPFCMLLPENIFDIRVLDNQNNPITDEPIVGSADGTTIENLQPGTYTVKEIEGSNNDQLRDSPFANNQCAERGFPDGGFYRNLDQFISYDAICYEYEDEQGIDCSEITLAAGEQKTCIVKNYIINGKNFR
jgi:hypothetical protein